MLNARGLGTISSRKGSWVLPPPPFCRVVKMLGSISRQVPRLFRQPGSLIFRRCLAVEAAQSGSAMSLTFGSPTEVSLLILLMFFRRNVGCETLTQNGPI